MNVYDHPILNQRKIGLPIARPLKSNWLLICSGLHRLDVRSTSSKAAIAQGTFTPLLHLPPELRFEVYIAALSDCEPTLAFLQTCRQINMEAQAVLYERHAHFDSQSSLFGWIERSRSSNLNRVKTLTLRITDIDLSSLLGPYEDQQHARASAWSLYQDELNKLDRALTALPGLLELTIKPPKHSHSQLLRSMYLSFLVLIPPRLSKLNHLIVDDNDEILTKIPQLRNVQRLSFTSTSKPAEPAESDRKVPHIQAAASSPKSKPRHRPRRRSSRSGVATDKYVKARLRIGKARGR